MIRTAASSDRLIQYQSPAVRDRPGMSTVSASHRKLMPAVKMRSVDKG